MSELHHKRLKCATLYKGTAPGIRTRAHNTPHWAPSGLNCKEKPHLSVGFLYAISNQPALLRHQSANLAPGGSIMMPQAGTTGFEPVISCLTGRCVKPGYTTPPRTTIISYQICRYCSNPYPQRNIQVSLAGLMGLPAPVPGVPETTVTFQ